MSSKKRAKTAPAGWPAPSASPVDDAPWARNCPDCVPELHVQGGAWGWAAHRYALHGEGDDPGPHPAPAQAPTKGRPRWSEADRAEFHRRRAAAARRARLTPPPRTPGPGGHYPAGPR